MTDSCEERFAEGFDCPFDYNVDLFLSSNSMTNQERLDSFISELRAYGGTPFKSMEKQQFMPHNFALLAVEVQDDCAPNIRKILKDRWYLFNDWYHVEDNHLVKNLDKDYIRNLYGTNISISAIAGKNGSGKSSLMELVYRIANNLSFIITQGLERSAARPLFYVEGICATLWFEADECLGWVKCENDDITFKWGKDDEISLSYSYNNDGGYDADIIKAERNYIARHFCFNLVINYALFTLSSIGFKGESGKRHFHKTDKYQIKTIDRNGEWIDSIYYKNDGYQACLGIEPFKGDRIIDIDNQCELCEERTSALIAFSGKNEFFDGYSVADINILHDEKYVSRSFNKNKEEKNWSLHPESEISTYYANKNKLAYEILASYGYVNLNFDSVIVKSCAAYIVTKTLGIVEKYDRYKGFICLGGRNNYAKNTKTTYAHFLKHVNEKDVDLGNLPYPNAQTAVWDLCLQLRTDKSHITQKLHQALNMMDVLKDKVCDEVWMQQPESTYFQFIKKYYDVDHFDTLKDTIDHMPPPFYKYDIRLNRNKKTNDGEDLIVKDIAFLDLSSGERQFIQTTTSIFYHIHNLISVEETDELVHYHNINLFLDEIEVCFHPEYQQKFIKLLLDMVKGQRLDQQCNINIVIATHSPFILSDIPKSNIICLQDGKVKSEKLPQETFCANIFDILGCQFFMDEFVGTFSSDVVDKIIKKVSQKCKSKKRLSQTEYINLKHMVNLIGDDFIRTKLLDEIHLHLPEKVILKEKEELIQKQRALKEEYDRLGEAIKRL